MSSIMTIKDLCLWYGKAQALIREQGRVKGFPDFARKKYYSTNRSVGMRKIHVFENAEPNERPDNRRQNYRRCNI